MLRALATLNPLLLPLLPVRTLFEWGDSGVHICLPETNRNFLSYPHRPPNSDFAAGDCLPLEVVTGHPHEPPASGPPPGATWDSVPCSCTYDSWMDALGLQVQCYRPGAGYCSQAGLGWVLERNSCGFTALGINVSVQLQALLCHDGVWLGCRVVLSTDSQSFL